MPDVRADFSTPAWLAPDDFRWVASPQPGVERVLLDRCGDEMAVATSLVRYVADSSFPAHSHGLGEEFLVLEGEFGDEHGRYPAGTYIRNPPGTRHTPFSDPGCVIWVKLRQFHPDDRTPVTVELDQRLPAAGVTLRELYRFRDEVVTCVAAAPGEAVTFAPADTVQEVLVVSGAVAWNGHALGERGWLRVPAGEGMHLAAMDGALLLHKTRPAYAVPV